jgi:potassium large conductance calcium-activated channel subfamily M alpha protein 1
MNSDAKIFPSSPSKVDHDDDDNHSVSSHFHDKNSEQDDTNDKETVDHVEIYRMFLKNIVENTVGGRLYSSFIIYTSVLSCLQGIVATYYDDGSPVTTVFNRIELALALVFLFDWSLLLFLAERKVTHFQSWYCMIDLTTCIPILLTYGSTCPSYDDAVHGSILSYVLCGLSSTRILRALRLRRRFVMIPDEVSRYTAEIALWITVLIFFNSAVMQYLEAQQNLPYHTWMYYSVVTIATIGYGDILPLTDLGRFAAMVMIVTAVITVPQMVNELNAKVAESSVYARMQYIPKAKLSSHVLICGDISSTSLRDFFNELFHEDHDVRNLHAVILQPLEPSYEVLQILKDVNFSLCVTYLQGSVLSAKDLGRALASRAKVVFIMTNKFSTDPDQEDAKTILQQFSILRYLRVNSPSSSAFFCSQLIRPENKRQLAVNQQDVKDNFIVVCLNEIKMGVLAKAVVFPVSNSNAFLFVILL